MSVVPELTPQQDQGTRHRRTLAHTRERHEQRAQQQDPFAEAKSLNVEHLRRQLQAEALLREGLTPEQRKLIKLRMSDKQKQIMKLDERILRQLRRQEELERLTGY